MQILGKGEAKAPCHSIKGKKDTVKKEMPKLNIWPNIRKTEPWWAASRAAQPKVKKT